MAVVILKQQIDVHMMWVSRCWVNCHLSDLDNSSDFQVVLRLCVRPLHIGKCAQTDDYWEDDQRCKRAPQFRESGPFVGMFGWVTIVVVVIFIFILLIIIYSRVFIHCGV